MNNPIRHTTPRPAYHRPYASPKENTTTLSDRDRDEFIDAVEEEDPNENLQEAAERHRQLLIDSDKKA